jgi:hypothetical protein
MNVKEFKKVMDLFSEVKFKVNLQSVELSATLSTNKLLFQTLKLFTIS